MKNITKETFKKAFKNVCTAKAMAELYEENFKLVSKYVHATSRGHEVIQTALGMQLLPQDYAFPYYRDDSMLLSFGCTPKDLMLQLLAKKDDPFSGGRTYYSHPSLRDDDKPKVPHQSSATGMQAIPATGAAMGFWYKEAFDSAQAPENWSLSGAEAPIVVCSLGDASVTEGEIAEAFQMAGLKQLPILYLVQDNGWDISANAAETRAQDAFEYAKGFHGLEAISIDGTDFIESYTEIQKVIATIRKERRPFLVHAKVPLLNHHTSGVRMEWYRDDLDEARLRDPYPKIKKQLMDNGFSENELKEIETSAYAEVRADFEEALKAEDPKPSGIVKWYVEVFDTEDEMVAFATILTMVQKKQTTFVEITSESIPFYLSKLSESTQPKWGTMTPQHMVEHLEFGYRIASGEMQNFDIATPEEYLEKTQETLWNYKPMPKDFHMPLMQKGKLEPLEHPDLETAKQKMLEAREEYLEFFKENSDTLTKNAVFGYLNKYEWYLLERKHFNHHFNQFNLI